MMLVERTAGLDLHHLIVGYWLELTVSPFGHHAVKLEHGAVSTKPLLWRVRSAIWYATQSRLEIACLLLPSTLLPRLPLYPSLTSRRMPVCTVTSQPSRKERRIRQTFQYWVVVTYGLKAASGVLSNTLSHVSSLASGTFAAAS